MKRILATGLLIAGAAGQAAPAGNRVFVAPQDYVGRTVQVCGYAIYNTILENRRQPFNRTHGVAIDDPNPLPPGFRGQVCVEGEITETCGESQRICSEALFEHAISISRVLSDQPDPVRR